MDRWFFYAAIFLVALGATIIIFIQNDVEQIGQGKDYNIQLSKENRIAFPVQLLEVSKDSGAEITIGFLNLDKEIKGKTSRNLVNTPVIECSTEGFKSSFNTRRGKEFSAMPNEEIRYILRITDLDSNTYIKTGKTYVCSITIFYDRDLGYDDRKNELLDASQIVLKKDILIKVAP